LQTDECSRIETASATNNATACSSASDTANATTNTEATVTAVNAEDDAVNSRAAATEIIVATASESLACRQHECVGANHTCSTCTDGMHCCVSLASHICA
jgi:hypothetical protein